MTRNAAVQELYRYLSGVADDASTMPISELSFAERVDAAGVIGEFIDRLAAARSDLLRAADAVAVDGERVTDRVYTDRRQMPRTINAQVKQARVLDEYTILRDAWRSGRMSEAQLRGILTGLDQLPVALGPEQKILAQEDLVRYCAEFDPRDLTDLAAHILKVIDPETADAEEKRKVEAEAKRAYKKRGITLRDDGDGSFTVFGSLPKAVGLRFKRQLDSAMPSSASYLADGDEVPTHAARRVDALERWMGAFTAISDQFCTDELKALDAAQESFSTMEVEKTQAALNRRVLEVLSALPAGNTAAAKVYLTMTVAEFEDRTAQAELFETGGRLATNETSTMSCDASFARVVLGAKSEILDVGREKRFHPKAIRAAIAFRDKGCSFPGCDAPVIVCEAHHSVPWRAGGRTNLASGVMVCPRHHRKVEPNPALAEDLQWQIIFDQGTGLPIYIPPRDVDPDRRPRCNARFLIGNKDLRERFEEIFPSRRDEAFSYGRALPTTPAVSWSFGDDEDAQVWW